jgi:hypothetical protein
VVGGVGAVGAVLAGAVVAQADLVLVVEPGLVVVGPGGVQDPAAEALADRGQVGLVGLAVGAAEGGQQVRVGADEAIPDVQDLLDPGARTSPERRRAARSSPPSSRVALSSSSSWRPTGERATASVP